MSIGQYVSNSTFNRIFNAAIDKSSLKEAAMDYKNPLLKLLEYLCSCFSTFEGVDIKAEAKAAVAKAVKESATNCMEVEARRGGMKAHFLSRRSFSIEGENGEELFFKLRELNGNVEVIDCNEGKPNFDKVVYTAYNLTFSCIKTAKA